MKALIAKTKGKVVPFEKDDKCSQVFYEELARMPVVGSAVKTDLTAASELVKHFSSGVLD